MDLTLLPEYALYFIALINPPSKVMVLSAIAPETSNRELMLVSLRSSLAGVIMLAILAVAGRLILNRVFHVELYALQIAGGIVLFLVGLRALRKGRFFEFRPGTSLSEASMVPLASPMIAGPATIAAVIHVSVERGLPLALCAVTLAAGVNLVAMIFARPISRALNKVSLMGPLIRISGLIVATIAVQMVLDGGREWYGLLVPATRPAG